ncbi:MAG: MutT related protein [Candidatus Collierbacteria bacterium GW2011_GWC2_44_18]|uniref:8-oxo-dGTP diphosphatase n=2 Tax=Microgenomates group TaxID=1794810 RepID=A0A0G1J279_9BACT|nr:MAG: MutT related protein [Microgenomates group bacterium GW2011_GWC1_44_10]KKT48272.1 MAG: MutT related protein [Candidatus Collierbacteria bacterium GW2011_GWC2_44_18]KKT65438.1 MAG: MutT related protein [Candidatus Woesebacteria bacterium GW2011_GWA2_44_33]
MRKFAVAAVIRQGNKILLHQRSMSSRGQAGKWENAGGEVENDETPEQAIVREIMEELNVVFVPGKILYEDDFENGEDVWHVMVFGGTITGSPKIVSEEISMSLKWYEISKLNEVDLASYTRQDFLKFGWVK